MAAAKAALCLAGEAARVNRSPQGLVKLGNPW